MQLVPLGTMEMAYASLDLLDFGPVGKAYGHLEGRVTGDRLSGEVHLTNIGDRRPDGVTVPRLRGVLTTDDGASVWIESDGFATLRESDGARIVVSSIRFTTADPRYRWLTTVLGVVEGVFDSADIGGATRGTIWECRPAG